MAREKVRTARALADLPRVDEAFSKGEISYTKVRALTRVATPDNTLTCYDDKDGSVILRAKLRAEDGAHVTCIGTDSPEKSEIDPQVMAAADLIVVNSLHQCLTRGDFHNAVAAGAVQESSAVDLGTLLVDTAFKRKRNDITIADLTGLAVQDICMAKHIIQNLPEPA